METFDDYVNRVREHSQHLQPYSSYPGLLRRPFLNDNVISFALRLQTQVTAANPDDRMDMAKVASARLQQHYGDLYQKQRLFIASQQLFALPDVTDNDDPFHIHETQVFNNATVTGRLEPFNVITTEIPQICIKIGDACIRYIELDGFENEYTPDTVVSIPTTHVEHINSSTNRMQL